MDGRQFPEVIPPYRHNNRQCVTITPSNITTLTRSVWCGIKRLVGNRANIFLENAVIMYHMATYYKQYCTWIIEDARAASSLHTRIVPKLRNPKMMAAMRARSIMFLQVSQPLRVACKSAGYVEGLAPSQLDIAPVWCRLMKEVDRMIEDPRLLLK